MALHRLPSPPPCVLQAATSWNGWPGKSGRVLAELGTTGGRSRSRSREGVVGPPPCQILQAKPTSICAIWKKVWNHGEAWHCRHWRCLDHSLHRRCLHCSLIRYQRMPLPIGH
ncbi:hypothetical protein BS78_06G093000 [Paspalum vaginatum]|nr:hypothetical protein BS78_06G093000 [Paspalum vaginatum]